MTNETEIAGRLARLEANVRRWRAFAVITAVIAVVAAGLTMRTLRTPTELKIAGDDGAMLILRADNLAFWDGKGGVTASIDTDHHFGRLALYGQADVNVQVAANTAASVKLTAKGPHNAMLTAADQSSGLSLLNGAEHASLETADNVASTLWLGSSDERGTTVITDGGTKLFPRLQLAAKGGSPAVVLAADPRGAAITLDDASARRSLTTAP